MGQNLITGANEEVHIIITGRPLFSNNDEDVRYEFKDLSSDSNEKVFSSFEEENQKYSSIINFNQI